MGINCLLKHAAFRLNAASFGRWVGTKVLTDTSKKTVVFIIYLDQTLWTQCFMAHSTKRTWALHRCVSIIRHFHRNFPLFQAKVTNTHSPPAKLSPPKSATARKQESANQNTTTDTDSTSMWGKKVWTNFYYFRHKFWIMGE